LLLRGRRVLNLFGSTMSYLGDAGRWREVLGPTMPCLLLLLLLLLMACLQPRGSAGWGAGQGAG